LAKSKARKYKKIYIIIDPFYLSAVLIEMTIGNNSKNERKGLGKIWKKIMQKIR
jgi:hypothetical protein